MRFTTLKANTVDQSVTLQCSSLKQYFMSIPLCYVGSYCFNDDSDDDDDDKNTTNNNNTNNNNTNNNNTFAKTSNSQ